MYAQKKGGEAKLGAQRTREQVPQVLIDNQDRIVFTTRHAEAWEWAKRKGLDRAVFSKRLPWNLVKDGTIVCGILPVKLVSKVCQRGARYFHLTIQAPPEKRGRDLLPDEMDRYNARLEEYIVKRVLGEGEVNE